MKQDNYNNILVKTDTKNLIGYVLESYYCDIGELILFLPTVLISYIPRNLNVKPHKDD